MASYRMRGVYVMMAALVLKLISAGLIFLTGFLGGILPMIYRNNQRSERLLFYGEFFARGIFLSAGLIHLLPDADSVFREIRPNVHYPVVFAICVFTVFTIQFIEQCTSKFAAKTAFAQHWMPYLLLILLSIHSVIEGAALGIYNNISQVLIIFVAIISHKSAEAFALGVSMRSHKIPKKVMLGLIALFALMTPIGIISSSLILQFLSSNQSSLAQAIFPGIAAGTFLYIASFETPDLEGCIKGKSNLASTGFFGFGILIMALVALYL